MSIDKTYGLTSQQSSAIARADLIEAADQKREQFIELAKRISDLHDDALFGQVGKGLDTGDESKAYAFVRQHLLNACASLSMAESSLRLAALSLPDANDP